MKGTARQQPNRFGGLFALSNGIGLAMLGYVGLSALLTFVVDGWAADRGELVQAVAALARYALSLLVPFAFVGWMMRDEIQPVPHQPKIRDKSFWAAALAAGLGMACLGNFLAWLMQLTAAREGVELAHAAAITGESPVTRMVIFVGYSLLAALVEEIVFRGVVLRMLRPWGDVWAIWCSAALFALCHASPLQTLPALLTGGLLGILTVMTGGIGLSVVVHTCYNAMALVLNALLEENQSALPVLIIWGVMMVVGLLAAPRLVTRWNNCRIIWGRSRKDFYIAPLMMLAAAFMAVRIVAGI
ncbi:MAG: CPBP family intramembrane metalloprotease [Oscillospiraceae bacterium]|nr:CPBP family intramembrane metalloprotease [Oscillospiraceae bacterium]